MSANSQPSAGPEKSGSKSAKGNIDPAPPGPGGATATGSAPTGTRLRFDTSDVKSSYCNIVNASGTREEIVLSFGINQNWDIGAVPGEVDVKLLHRVVLSPFAAKRLTDMLATLVRDYEAKYGALK